MGMNDYLDRLRRYGSCGRSLEQAGSRAPMCVHFELDLTSAMYSVNGWELYALAGHRGSRTNLI